LPSRWGRLSNLTGVSTMRFVIASVLAAALCASVAAPAFAQVGGQAVSRAYTVEPFTPSTPVTIQGSGVRLRAEPFATQDTPVLSNGSTGLALTVVGIARQADWNWYQVVLRNGQKAFIRSDLTSAPSRGGTTPAATPVATAPQPPVAYLPPPVVTPMPQPQQPLPTIPTAPSTSSGAISLTPGGASPQLGAAPAPVDSGLISVSPTAPTPRFQNTTPTSMPAPATPAPADAPAAVYIPSTMAHLRVAEQIRAQLNASRCWTDSSNMMDASRLRAAFGVIFGPNGKFAAEPRLIEPATEPSSDPAMMVFIAKARAALRTCNAIGFTVPQAYYSSGQGELRIEFSAR
jgi:hypothetical protein